MAAGLIEVYVALSGRLCLTVFTLRRLLLARNEWNFNSPSPAINESSSAEQDNISAMWCWNIPVDRPV